MLDQTPASTDDIDVFSANPEPLNDAQIDKNVEKAKDIVQKISNAFLNCKNKFLNEVLQQTEELDVYQRFSKNLRTNIIALLAYLKINDKKKIEGINGLKLELEKWQEVFKTPANVLQKTNIDQTLNNLEVRLHHLTNVYYMLLYKQIKAIDFTYCLIQGVDRFCDCQTCVKFKKKMDENICFSVPPKIDGLVEEMKKEVANKIIVLTELKYSFLDDPNKGFSKNLEKNDRISSYLLRQFIYLDNKLRILPIKRSEIQEVFEPVFSELKENINLINYYFCRYLYVEKYSKKPNIDDLKSHYNRSLEFQHIHHMLCNIPGSDQYPRYFVFAINLQEYKHRFSGSIRFFTYKAVLDCQFLIFLEKLAQNKTDAFKAVLKEFNNLKSKLFLFPESFEELADMNPFISECLPESDIRVFSDLEDVIDKLANDLRNCVPKTEFESTFKDLIMEFLLQSLPEEKRLIFEKFPIIFVKNLVLYDLPSQLSKSLIDKAIEDCPSEVPKCLLHVLRKLFSDLEPSACLQAELAKYLGDRSFEPTVKEEANKCLENVLKNIPKRIEIFQDYFEEKATNFIRELNKENNKLAIYAKREEIKEMQDNIEVFMVFLNDERDMYQELIMKFKYQVDKIFEFSIHRAKIEEMDIPNPFDERIRRGNNLMEKLSIINENITNENIINEKIKHENLTNNIKNKKKKKKNRKKGTQSR